MATMCRRPASQQPSSTGLRSRDRTEKSRPNGLENNESGKAGLRRLRRRTNGSLRDLTTGHFALPACRGTRQARQLWYKAPDSWLLGRCHAASTCGHADAAISKSRTSSGWMAGGCCAKRGLAPEMLDNPANRLPAAAVVRTARPLGDAIALRELRAADGRMPHLRQPRAGKPAARASRPMSREVARAAIAPPAPFQRRDRTLDAKMPRDVSLVRYDLLSGVLERPADRPDGRDRLPHPVRAFQATGWQARYRAFRPRRAEGTGRMAAVFPRAGRVRQAASTASRARPRR